MCFCVLFVLIVIGVMFILVWKLFCESIILMILIVVLMSDVVVEFFVIFLLESWVKMVYLFDFVEWVGWYFIFKDECKGF